MKPIIAIVGRPNVGKSTLFNRLVGTRQAIVDPTPGVTRDRLYADAEWRGQVFTLVDTGGFEPLLEEEIPRKVREQAEQAIDEADLIVFMVDGRAGLVATDVEVAAILRRTQKPLLLAVNKLDHRDHEPYTAEFYRLGIEPLLPISAEHGRGVGELLDARVEARLEWRSVAQSLQGIRRCQVALLVLDAQEGLTDQDARLANYIYRMGKGSLILVNKADLLGGTGPQSSFAQGETEVRERLGSLGYSPVLFVSALT